MATKPASILDFVAPQQLKLRAEGPLFVKDETGKIATWRYTRQTPEGPVAVGKTFAVVNPRASALMFDDKGQPVMSADGQFQRKVSQDLADVLGIEGSAPMLPTIKGRYLADIDSLTLTPVSFTDPNYSPREIAPGIVKVYGKIMNGKFRFGTAAYNAMPPECEGNFTWKRIEQKDTREGATPQATLQRILTGFVVLVYSKPNWESMHVSKESPTWVVQDVHVGLIPAQLDPKTGVLRDVAGIIPLRSENRNIKFARKPPQDFGKIVTGISVSTPVTAEKQGTPVPETADMPF